MKNIKELVKDVERDLVINLTISLRHKRLDLKEARKIAKGFLSGSVNSYDELFMNLYSLSNQHNDARNIFVKYSPEYYEEKRVLSLNRVRLIVESENGGSK